MKRPGLYPNHLPGHVVEFCNSSNWLFYKRLIEFQQMDRLYCKGLDERHSATSLLFNQQMGDSHLCIPNLSLSAAYLLKLKQYMHLCLCKHGYKNGILISCTEFILRLQFLQIVSYYQSQTIQTLWGWEVLFLKLSNQLRIPFQMVLPVFLQDTAGEFLHSRSSCRALNFTPLCFSTCT